MEYAREESRITKKISNWGERGEAMKKWQGEQAEDDINFLSRPADKKDLQRKEPKNDHSTHWTWMIQSILQEILGGGANVTMHPLFERDFPRRRKARAWSTKSKKKSSAPIYRVQNLIQWVIGPEIDENIR